jgi:hypothetical protein
LLSSLGKHDKKRAILAGKMEKKRRKGEREREREREKKG